MDAASALLGAVDPASAESGVQDVLAAPAGLRAALEPGFGGEVVLFLVLGVLAGAHCLGMCGPIVAIYARRLSSTAAESSATDAGSQSASATDPPAASAAGPSAASAAGPSAASATDPPAASAADPSAARADSNRSARAARNHLTVFEVRQHLLYNLGRATSYAAIGGLAGLVGGTAFVAADQFGAAGTVVRAVAGVLAGVAIAVAGLGYLLGRPGALHGIDVPGFSDGIPGFSRATRRLTAGLTSRVDDLVHTPGIALLGAGHGLLPCPILYPAYLYALALGDPVRGAVALGALGLGTVPTMLAVGLAAGSLDLRSRTLLHRALGATLLLAAVVPSSHGLMLLGAPVPHVPLPAPTLPS